MIRTANTDGDRIELASGRVVYCGLPRQWTGVGCATGGCCRSQDLGLAYEGCPVCCTSCWVSGGQRHATICHERQCNLHTLAERALASALEPVDMATEILQARAAVIAPVRPLRPPVPPLARPPAVRPPQPPEPPPARLLATPPCYTCLADRHRELATHICLWCQKVSCRRHCEPVARGLDGRWEAALCAAGVRTGLGPRGYCREPIISRHRDRSRTPPPRHQSGDEPRSSGPGAGRAPEWQTTSGAASTSTAGTGTTSSRQTRQRRYEPEPSLTDGDERSRSPPLRQRASHDRRVSTDLRLSRHGQMATGTSSRSK